MKAILMSLMVGITLAVVTNHRLSLRSSQHDNVLLGVTTTGKKYYQVPREKIDIRYLSQNDDKLMNRLILDGYALVLESKPMLSSDDSHCGCNCRCCFNLQAEGKNETQCSLDCGCDCNCCRANEPKLTQYWMDKKGALEVAN